jgi:hypothetical protein
MWRGESTVSPGFDETAGSVGVSGENGSVSAACPLRHIEVRGAISGFLARDAVTPLPPVLWGRLFRLFRLVGDVIAARHGMCDKKAFTWLNDRKLVFRSLLASTSNHTNVTVITVRLTAITEPQNRFVEKAYGRNGSHVLRGENDMREQR